eukprot:TRINITY_DN2129_c0_g3_i2.p1 TRINITY_DN2129_c0_g3~~TRINITY_DN2129_c0_g3_i2.p1  ORF type:complete len:565 (+),score=174.18 TRINITY_DN2129_c0_g3_i2:759-2453(+)
MYYSINFEFTHSSSRIFNNQTGATEESFLYQTTDERFFWNKNLVQPFIDAELHRLVLPVMSGFIAAHKSSVSNPDNKTSTLFDFVLISRRSCARTGARYFARGINPQGNVANFVETEQLLFIHNDDQDDEAPRTVCSFVQVRGSIPHFWVQPPIGLKPKPMVVQDPYATEAFAMHFQELNALYGPQMCVNLVNMHGKEMGVGDAFETLVNLYNSDDVRYTWFDFHEECAHNKYENLSLLMERIQNDIDSHLSTTINIDGEIVMQQNGCVRTNCIDCLDRTNVVQSHIARDVLLKQFKQMGMLSNDADTFTDQTEFEKIFKTVWADNADSMSKQYAGTGALKTDFTRTGKRSNKGMIQDGINSVKRFFINTYQDSQRQEMLDLFLGRFAVRPSLDLSTAGDLFQVSIVSGRSGAESALLFIDLASNALVYYNPANGFTHCIALSDIRVVERVSHEPEFVHIRVNTSPTPREFKFDSARSRELFLSQLMLQAHQVNNQFLSFITPEEAPRHVSVHTVSWNLGLVPPPENFDTLLPSGHDVYAIAVQDVHYQRNKNETTLSAHAHLA